MPVNRLKLLAFMFGAATAGFTGTISALSNGGVSRDYDVGLLITIYAIVIPGGSAASAASSSCAVVNGAPELLVVVERALSSTA